MTARWFVAPDAEDEPTLWRQEPGAEPEALLRRSEVRSGSRPYIWPLVEALGPTWREEEGAGFTPMQIATGAIDLFFEYRDQHGYDEDRARAQAALDIAEGAAVLDEEIQP